MLLQPFGNGMNDRRFADHPDFDGIDAYVVKQRVHLLRDEVGRHGKHTGDGPRILRR